jgi:hypothetical protein
MPTVSSETPADAQGRGGRLGGDTLMSKPLSFFRLTLPRPAPDTDNPLLALTGEEFDACCVAAHPLFQALVETINTYSETHPDLRLLAVYIAADMLRELVKQDLREADADA